MIDLKFLGNGSAFNTTKVNTSAYFIVEDTLFLIDCGCNVFDKIINKNILDEIKYVNIFITHTHPDHVGSLGNLLFYCYFTKNIVPKIYTHPEVVMYVNRFLTSQGMIPDMHYILNECFIGLRSFESNIGKFNIHIDSMLTYHTHELPSCYFNVVIIDSDANCNSFVYTGDLSDQYMNDVLKHLKAGKTVYIECAKSDYNHIHVSIKALKEKIPIEFKDKIYCMHIEDNGEYITEAGFNVVTII